MMLFAVRIVIRVVPRATGVTNRSSAAHTMPRVPAGTDNMTRCLLVCAIAFVATSALTSTAACAADWTLADVIALPANRVDRVRAPAPTANINRLGYFSDISYEPGSRTWYALSDRGPGGGVVDYATRVQQMLIPINSRSGALHGRNTVIRTILFTDANGQPFNGLNPTLLSGSPATLGNSFDPEGLAVGRNGHFYVADEYGPSLYEFDRTAASCARSRSQPTCVPTGRRAAELHRRPPDHRPRPPGQSRLRGLTFTLRARNSMRAAGSAGR